MPVRELRKASSGSRRGAGLCPASDDPVKIASPSLVFKGRRRVS